MNSNLLILLVIIVGILGFIIGLSTAKDLNCEVDMDKVYEYVNGKEINFIADTMNIGRVKAQYKAYRIIIEPIAERILKDVITCK